MDPFDLRNWNGFFLATEQLSEPAIIDQVVIDSRRIDSSHSLFVALPGENTDGHQYVEHAVQQGAKYVLVNRHWKPSVSQIEKTVILRVDSPVQSLQQIASAYRKLLPAKIIGLAGTFGKTMVKDFLHQLLSTQKKVAASPESFNSQIGVSLSLLSFRQEHEIGIIEAAFSKQGEMNILAETIQPDYSLLTPVGKKHLSTLHDIQTLINESVKLLCATPKTGWILLPEDVYLHDPSLTFSAPYYYWNKPHADLPHAISKEIDSYTLFFPDGFEYSGKIQQGHAYFLNLVNMATKVAWLFGISSSHITKVLEQYVPEPTRVEMWKSMIGTHFVNDTYCSDPQSIDNSFRYFHYSPPTGRKIFVFGGMRNNATNQSVEYRRIGKTIVSSNIQLLILVGQKPFISLIEEVKEFAHKTEILAFDTYDEALFYLQKHATEHDLVLFKGEKKLPFDQLTRIFNGNIPNNICFINLAAIEENLSLLRTKLPSHTRIMVMVKALAYGTDDIRITKFLVQCGIDIIGVSYVEEGITLKRSGVQQPIFSIHVSPQEVPSVVEWGIEVGVSDEEIIRYLAKESTFQQKQIKLHLHINTGMGRFGCHPSEALQLAKLIQSFPSLILEGIMTHFACAENPKEDAFTLHQVQLFDQIIHELQSAGIDPPWKHAANSSASLRFSLPQYNMVRLGVAVYGLYTSEAVREKLDLRLAMTLISKIVSITTHPRGDTISYGRSYVVERDQQKIAVLPIGYFDGLHRNYSGKAHVLIRGKKAPMVGKICMDYLMIDITEIPDISVGDQVLVYGEDKYGYYLSPEELAESGNSIIHELITCLGPRIQRVFIYEQAHQIR